MTSSPLARLLPAALALVLAAPAGAASFTVKERAVEDRKAVFATVQSVDVVPARARIGGTVTELAVDEGAMVRAGDVLARVDDPKLGLELVAVDARIEALKAQRDLARIALERARELRRSGAGSQARLDEARTDLDVVGRDLAAMRAERDVVARRLEEGKVLAPASGRVLSVPVTDGTVAMPGEVIATMAQESYILRMHLPERHARYLAVGDPVLVGERGLADAARADGTRTGTVKQVYPELDRGRVVADVTVEGLGDFFVGERARVWVSTGTRRALVIPPKYLFSRFGLHFVTLAGGTEAVVQPGMPVAGGIEILSGIRPGDVLVPPGAAANAVPNLAAGR